MSFIVLFTVLCILTQFWFWGYCRQHYWTVIANEYPHPEYIAKVKAWNKRVSIMTWLFVTVVIIIVCDSMYLVYEHFQGV